MLLAFITLAAEEAEPSKTAFYIGGGLLAVWAVVLSVIGLRQPSFPANKGAMRGVLAISAVRMALAMSTAVITA